MQKVLFVTGGSGFIGSALIRYLLTNTQYTVVNIDKLTYAANPMALLGFSDESRYIFSQTDITDQITLQYLFKTYQPDAVMHLAAESHVDRSISGSAAFIQTNIVGTYTLLEACRIYLNEVPSKHKNFRFHHISTDEVFGDLEGCLGRFSEVSSYAPSSPYAASKASSDHLVRAWYRTYDLPIIITNCSNNYGPWQHTEKLIPHMISKALKGEKLPIYGDGQQIRDWLYVDDHVKALHVVLEHGLIGETYNIGGNNEVRNIELVETICDLLNELEPTHYPYRSLITFVTDRPGHDRRYAIDPTKIMNNLGWQPQETWRSGLKKTVNWYLSNITRL